MLVIRLPEDGAGALKPVGVLVKYFNIYVSTFVGKNNIQYKIRSTYIKI
jgi:hypothetical protein